METITARTNPLMTHLRRLAPSGSYRRQRMRAFVQAQCRHAQRQIARPAHKHRRHDHHKRAYAYAYICPPQREKPYLHACASILKYSAASTGRPLRLVSIVSLSPSFALPMLSCAPIGWPSSTLTLSSP